MVTPPCISCRAVLIHQFLCVSKTRIYLFRRSIILQALHGTKQVSWSTTWWMCGTVWPTPSTRPKTSTRASRQNSDRPSKSFRMKIFCIKENVVLFRALWIGPTTSLERTEGDHLKLPVKGTSVLLTHSQAPTGPNSQGNKDKSD